MAAKVEALYQSIRPPGGNPMGDFDERDLVRHAKDAGFPEINLELRGPYLNLDARPSSRPGLPCEPRVGMARSQPPAGPATYALIRYGVSAWDVRS